MTTLKDPNLPMHNLRYKYKAFLFCGSACMKCGWREDVRLLCIHHIKGKRAGNDVENLSVLCPMCHAREHYKGGATWQAQQKAIKGMRELYESNAFFRELVIRETGHPFAVEEG